MIRRALLAGALLAGAALGPVVAGTAVAQPAAKVEVRPSAKLFPYLDFYYRIDPARRTRFRLSYRLHARGAPQPALRVVMLDGPGAPLPLSPDGWFERLPTAAELERKPQVRVEGPPDAQLQVSLVPEAVVRPGREMDPAEVTAAAGQLNAALKSAGPLSFAIPRFSRVVFAGAEGAVVVGADGAQTTLPVRRGAPVAGLAVLEHARALRFAKAPSRVLLTPDIG